MTTNAAAPRTASLEVLRVLMSIGQVAEHLGVNVRHVRRLVAERRIPFIKWGHLLRFDPEKIAAWIREQHIPVRCP